MARAFFVVRIYVKLIRTHLRAHLEYRGDFWVGILGMALTHGAPLVFVWAVFLRVPEVGGWTAWEVAMLYGLAILPRGITEVLCDGAWSMRLLINTGDFDRLLVRPLSPVVQVLTWISSMHGFGSLLLGAVVILRAKSELDLAWSLPQWGFLLLTLIGATVITGAINLAANCIGFWTPSSNSAFPFLASQVKEFVKFPITVYGKGFQILFTWILPYAFISYFPGAVLLERPDANPVLGYGAPVAALAVALATALVWRTGLGRYQSTGN